MIEKLVSKVISNKYFSNTSWLLAERFLQMLITLYVGIRLAIYMTEDEWGFYNWAMSLVLIFSELAMMGLPSIVVKFLVNKNYHEQEILGSVLILRLIGGSFAIGAICALTLLLEANNFNRALVFLVALPYLLRSFDLISYYFEANVISRYTVIARLSGVIVNNLLKLFIIIFNWPVFYVYLVFIIDAILFVSILLSLYSYTGGRVLKWKYNHTVAKKLIQSSWPLIFTVLITNLYMRVDQLMIKEMLGNAANGNYASAVKLSGAWYALPWIITGSVFPAILNALKLNYELFLQRLSALYQCLILLALIVILPVTLFSEEVIAIVYSGKYAAAAEVLKIHIWASVFVFIGFAGNKWLIAENLEKWAFIFTASGAVVNILLNFYVIPRFGINGAAWATLFSQFTTYFLMPVFYSKTRVIFKVQLISLLKSFTIVLPVKSFYDLIKGVKS